MSTRNLSRKEERERKAKIRADQYSHPVEWNDCYHHWIEGAEWADKTAWEPADGDDLPEIDREVIALAEENGCYKVVFAHRPKHNGDVYCFGKGSWNQPNVKWWLDLELPKIEE